MVQIPESHRDILDSKSFAHVATVDADGTPQVTPVWVEFDGEYISINSAKGRKKDRNMVGRPQVAVSIQDPADPYRYLGIQGRVVEFTTEGAVEQIHRLSRKYTGKNFGDLGNATRVTYKIEPEKVWVNG
ncbi:MAG: PPOX class F420-dependent oxidoreductase [Caldilineaceae bacterium]|nr:PPOX class F420-dependent oxidoreductase [Caldilineaceae bacterium]MBP8107011.1 PPOX class F420-dependent oxidoreductase [Caldilineaceae bacterium]MBP8121995.1 PPOX class F420-dependent oxidoreductase [Caldilineaceae bacterium]MBP9072640.1 PPOX class F420-dependent oxidoreductase [Caldilineaceae bacterium]